MKYNKQIKTGILAIIGILCFVIGFNFLKSKSIFSSSAVYYAKFPHSGGLNSGTPVTVNGFKVGSVDKVAIEEGTGKILVTFSVEKDFEFSKDSKAELFSSLLGNTGLQIVPVFHKGANAQSGDTLPSSIQVGMLESITSKMEPTQDRLNALLNTSDTVLSSVARVLDKKGEEHLQKSLEQLRATLTNLNRASLEFNQILKANKENLNTTLANLSVMSTNLAEVSQSFKEANMKQMLENANKTLADIQKAVSDINNGKGSLGMLMKDDALYKNLNGSSKQLEMLLQDFRLNPKRYVHFSIFGKKQKNYVAPEEAEEALRQSE